MADFLVLKPRLSEKAYANSQALNVYGFTVPKNVSKQVVARAVANQFNVSVTNVNIANISGKAKRSVRKNGRAVTGVRSDMKKAYVTVKEGDSIPIFAAEEAENAKKAKAAEKAAKKEKK